LYFKKESLKRQILGSPTPNVGVFAFLQISAQTKSEIWTVKPKGLFAKVLAQPTKFWFYLLRILRGLGILTAIIDKT